MSRKLKAIATLSVTLVIGLCVWLIEKAMAQGPPVPPVEIASTTTTTTAGLVPVIKPTTGAVVGFKPSGNAALFANADINGDGINDLVMVVVDAPRPPIVGGTGAAPARYRVYVVDGATGLTIHNISIVSPTWYAAGDPF